MALNVRCFLGQRALATAATGAADGAAEAVAPLPSLRLMAPDVFRVTHFREPVARQNSEFWFTGPGARGREFNTAPEWRAWMNATDAHMVKHGFIAYREVCRHSERAVCHSERHVVHC